MVKIGFRETTMNSLTCAEARATTTEARAEVDTGHQGKKPFPRLLQRSRRSVILCQKALIFILLPLK